MSAWTALKDKRSTKSASAVSVTQQPASSEGNVGAGSTSKFEGATSTPTASSSAIPYAHPDLPSSLEVRSIPGRGRGVVAKERIAAGTTLVLTSPLLSVLENRSLATHCSFCFRSEEDTEQQKKLLQCSLCHVVQYCSAACQTVDWKLHRSECKALKAAAKQTGRRVVPDTPIRAIARLLWKNELEGGKLLPNFDSLQSHRDELSADEQERYFQLSMALSQFVGSQELVSKAVGGSGKGMMDLISRFTLNSFSLTSPSDVTNIGVSISPLTALFNHSCTGINAAVVFPSFPSPSKPKHMSVVALRTIEAGEEVLTSYIDIALPRAERKKELNERYKFECDCEGCRGSELDPREALACSAKGCDGLIAFPSRETSPAPTHIRCGVCRAEHPYKIVYPAVDAAKTALLEAEKVQYSDPSLAVLHLTHSITALTTSLSPCPPLSPSSHPLLSIRQLLLTLQLHSSAFSDALTTAHQAWRGVSRIYPSGHPVRAVLLSTVARLETMPPPSEEGPEAELRYWGDGEARERGLRRLVEATKEAEVAFGRGGGEMGRRLRGLIKDQEEGVAMARRVRAAGRS